MKTLLINSVCGVKSTGRICTDIAVQTEKDGSEVMIAYGRDIVPEQYRKYAVKIGNDFDFAYNLLLTRLFDRHGYGSRTATKRFLRWADEYDPEVLWLHNIHGYYINIELLFDWIKKRPDMKVIWTLHSCWAFTGHCTHFEKIGCTKWKTQCENCPQKKSFPSSLLLDNSRQNYIDKKRLFCGVKDLTIVTPSKWLASLVKESFLKEYPVEVHYNTIDTEAFRPRSSDFKAKYHIEGKKIILGVATSWGESKGL